MSALIRDLRLGIGWSQARLADELCRVSSHATVTRETVSRWESGKRTPGPFWLRHLATALQTPLATFDEATRMERRTLLTDLAATAIAPLAAADLIRAGFSAALTSKPTDDDWICQGDQIVGTAVRYGPGWSVSASGRLPVES